MNVCCCFFGLFIAIVGILSMPMEEDDIEHLINRFYSKLINQETSQNAIKAPKTLLVNPSIENFNVYLDEAPATLLNENAPDVSSSRASSVCNKKHDSSVMPMPFPAFISPLMTLLATDYTTWRNKIPLNLSCVVKELLAVDSHPCPHENSSCVIIALPKNHIFFGCMNDKTGEVVAPNRWNPKQEINSDSFLFDFRVPNFLHLDRKCQTTEDGSPICRRANIFYKNRIIAEDNACCCKGDFCADVLFDQHGFNPVPFIHVETEIPQRILISNAMAPAPKSKPDKSRSRSLRQSNFKPAFASNSDSTIGTISGFDWGFTQTEVFVIGLTIFVILIVVVTIGFWFVFERNRIASLSLKSEIDTRTGNVFTVETSDIYPFTVYKQGRSIT